MSGITIGNKVQALGIQRSLNDSTEALSKSYERLSTGLRINSASDDAAGLAIADSLRTNSRLYTTATRNINDGISATNIIDGAITSQKQIVTRLSELAEQSANGTFSESQRKSMNTEYQALVSEFSRIGDSTKFNGINLLLGGHGSNASSLALQTGINGSSNAVLSQTTKDLGSYSGIVNVSDLGAGVSGVKSLEELMAGYNNFVLTTTVTDANGVSHDLYLGLRDGTGGLIRFDTWMRASESDGASSSNPDKFVQSTNGTGSFTFDTSTGIPTTNLIYTAKGFTNPSGDPAGVSANISIDISGLRFSQNSASYAPALGATTALNTTGIETSNRALSALTVTKARLDELSAYSGEIGAFQSRLQISKNISEISKEGVLTAESRIRDVDVAEETANLVKNQILQQSAAHILSAVGLSSEIALKLLQ